MRSIWSRHLRTGLYATALTMSCVGTAQDNPSPTPTMDLQVSVESGDYLAPDYLSIPVHVTVTNLGPYTAEDVTVAIELPPFLPGQPMGSEHSCSTSGSSFNCSLLPLAAGASTVVSVEVFLQPEPLGTFNIRATTTGKGVDIAPENNQATLSTSGPGQLRLSGGCSSVAGSGTALAGLALLLPLLRQNRWRSSRQKPEVPSRGLSR